MRRGALDFLVSVIYSSLVVLAIFLIFQAFTFFAAPREDAADQLEKIERVIENSYAQGTPLALEEGERLFIGFADGTCEAQLIALMGQAGVCGENAFCYCYAFSPPGEEGPGFRLCKERTVQPDTTVNGNRCETFDEGLYSVAFEEREGESNVLRFEPRAEGT